MDKQTLLDNLKLLIKQYQSNGLKIRFNLSLPEDRDWSGCKCDNFKWYGWNGRSMMSLSPLAESPNSSQELLDSCSDLLDQYEQDNDMCIIGACLSFHQDEDIVFCNCPAEAAKRYYIWNGSDFAPPTYSL